MKKAGDHSFLKLGYKNVFICLVLTLYYVYVSESQSSP